MIKNLGHIIQGWGIAIGKRLGLVSISTDKEKLSQLRLSICKMCPWVRTKKILEIINDEDVEINALFCSKCKCPCLEKSLVADEKCPISKW